mmetsp:Transcript_52751/g.137435  ORF Transcript_52751/g.137435 Transcript_52751/m.137435 type:complete len:462 (-) Transcript_52751:1812-3197(-)
MPGLRTTAAKDAFAARWRREARTPHTAARARQTIVHRVVRRMPGIVDPPSSGTDAADQRTVRSELLVVAHRGQGQVLRQPTLELGLGRGTPLRVRAAGDVDPGVLPGVAEAVPGRRRLAHHVHAVDQGGVDIEHLGQPQQEHDVLDPNGDGRLLAAVLVKELHHLVDLRRGHAEGPHDGAELVDIPFHLLLGRDEARHLLVDRVLVQSIAVGVQHQEARPKLREQRGAVGVEVEVRYPAREAGVELVPGLDQVVSGLGSRAGVAQLLEGAAERVERCEALAAESASPGGQRGPVVGLELPATVAGELLLWELQEALGDGLGHVVPAEGVVQSLQHVLDLRRRLKVRQRLQSDPAHVRVRHPRVLGQVNQNENVDIAPTERTWVPEIVVHLDNLELVAHRLQPQLQHGACGEHEGQAGNVEQVAMAQRAVHGPVEDHGLDVRLVPAHGARVVGEQRSGHIDR